MVIFSPHAETYFSSFDSIVTYLGDIRYIKIKARKLTASNFLLSTSIPLTGRSLYHTVRTIFQAEIRAGEVDIQPWTPAFGSFGFPINCIVEYLLSPYCMVKQHKTIIDDPLEDHGRTSFHPTIALLGAKTRGSSHAKSRWDKCQSSYYTWLSLIWCRTCNSGRWKRPSRHGSTEQVVVIRKWASWDFVKISAACFSFFNPF